jgi:hypothetical protein
MSLNEYPWEYGLRGQPYADQGGDSNTGAVHRGPRMVCGNRAC